MPRTAHSVRPFAGLVFLDGTSTSAARASLAEISDGLATADAVVVDRQIVEPHHDRRGRHLVVDRPQADRPVVRHARARLPGESELGDLLAVAEEAEARRRDVDVPL